MNFHTNPYHFDSCQEIRLKIQNNDSIPRVPLSTLVKDLSFELFELFPSVSEPSVETSDSLEELNHAKEEQLSPMDPKIKKLRPKKLPWSTEDDAILIEITKKYSYSWAKIQTRVEKLRHQKRSIPFLKKRYKIFTGKLEENKTKSPFTREEDRIIIEEFQKYGTDWAQMNMKLPNRTETSIKNRYYHIKKRASKQSNS